MHYWFIKQIIPWQTLLSTLPFAQPHSVEADKLTHFPFCKRLCSGPYILICADSSLITVTHTIVHNQLQELHCAGIYSVMPSPID